MKQLPLLCMALVLLVGFPASLQAQVILDTNFVISATIKPSDYPSWPHNLGAEKVVSGFDINNNGKKEFVVMSNPVDNNTPGNTADTTRPYLFWFEANGDGTYTLLWSAHVPGTNTGGFSYADFAVNDIDKDGKMEIVVIVPRATTDREDALLYVYEYDNGAFPTDPTVSSDLGLRLGMGYRATRIEVADVDGDGDNETVVTSRNDDYGGAGKGRSMMVHHFVGDINPSTFGYFEREFIDSSSVLKGGAVYDMGITDFDGDGNKEIWVDTWDLLSMAIYEATGKDTYAMRADINQARPDNDVGVRRSMRWYDADKDGKLEFYFAGITDSYNPGNLYMIPSTTDVSTLTTASIITVTPDLQPESEWSYEGADVGDINGDGLMDYVVAGAGPRREIFWLHYKGGLPADTLNYLLSTLYKDTLATDSMYSFMTVNICSDMDGDGKTDVFLPNRYVRSDVASDAAIVILKSKAGASGVEQIGNSAPAGYALLQNYPNPFNPRTEIVFETPLRGFVSLRIFDAVGREISTLVNRDLPAGNHRVTFDARALSSGVYFYTLKAGSFQQSRKMLVVK